IAPPPTDGGGSLLPEDPVVASSRMYNNAALLITVEQTAPGAGHLQIHIGTAANPHVYDASFPKLKTYDANSIIAPSTGDALPVRGQVTDPREELNGAPVGGVNMTTIDIGNLNDALNNPSTGALATNSTLAAAYNGVVYVYDKTTNAEAGASAGSLNAIRIVNGTKTPNVSAQNGNPIGFTVVSNNGVYVQGDYNTVQITAGGQNIDNPAAVMGDAVTALSAGWP